MKEKELVWVEKEFATKYKILEADSTKREERIKIFNEYMESVSEASRQEYKANLESLDEDLAIYNGLMNQIKQSFEKAKNTQLEASYAIWDKFDKERPEIAKKIEQTIKMLKPLEEELTKVNDLMGKIETYNIEKIIDIIERLSSLYGDNWKMVDFLINNFKRD